MSVNGEAGDPLREGAPTSPPLPESPPPKTRGRKRKMRMTAGIGGVFVVVAAILLKFLVFTGVGELMKPGGALDKTIFREDFSAENGAWDLRDTPDATVQFMDGNYRILVKTAGGEYWSFRGSTDSSWNSLVVEADTRKAAPGTPEGFLGVMCVVDQQNAYSFLIDPDSFRYLILKLEGDEVGDPLASGVDPAVIRQSSATNRVGAECSGKVNGHTDLVLSVNGQHVADVSDPTGLQKFSGMGLFVGSFEGGTDVRFDNVLLRRP